MYTDMTMITVDLANLELGAISGFTDLNPLFWLALHDYWIHLLMELGMPRLNAGMSLMIQPTDFMGEPADFSDVSITDPPFTYVPSGLELGVIAIYPQLNAQGLPNASN